MISNVLLCLLYLPMAVARRGPVPLIALLALAAAVLLPVTDVAIAADPATGRDAEPWSVAVLDFEAMDVPAELARRYGQKGNRLCAGPRGRE